MIQFRPHHFLCTLGFQGKGYSPAFVQNYQSIVQKLTEDPDTPIQVTRGLDNICRSCPKQVNAKTCHKQALIEKLDSAHQHILGLTEEQVISWKDAIVLIQKHMTLERFESACEGCEWKFTGMCESALKAIRHD